MTDENANLEPGADPGADPGLESGLESGAEQPGGRPTLKANDPLHGVTLEIMLRKLVNKYGWPGLAKRVRVNCLKNDPTMGSALAFFRRTPWARKKLEELYLNSKFWTRG